MTLIELIPIISGVASSVAAVFAYVSKEAVSALQEEHRSNIRRIEEDHKNDLQRQYELFKREIEFLKKIDDSHFDLRKESYAVLWRITSLLPKWPVNSNFKYKELDEYSKSLCCWYYGNEPEWIRSNHSDDDSKDRYNSEKRELNKRNVLPGGMLLTDDAKEAYFELQEKISEVKMKGQSKANDPLAKNDYETVRNAASALRTELTKDLLTRKEITANFS